MNIRINLNKASWVPQAVRDMTGIEWLIIGVILLILCGVCASGYSRVETCRELLALSKTRADTIDVRLACEVRSGRRTR